MKKTSNKLIGEARHWSLYRDPETAAFMEEHGVMNPRHQGYISGMYQSLMDHKNLPFSNKSDVYADRAIDMGRALDLETYAITACNAVKTKGTLPEYESFVEQIVSMLER